MLNKAVLIFSYIMHEKNPEKYLPPRMQSISVSHRND